MKYSYDYVNSNILFLFRGVLTADGPALLLGPKEEGSLWLW